jgi:hypothetical protein
LTDSESGVISIYRNSRPHGELHMFATAQKVSTPKTNAKKSTRTEYTIEGAQDLAALDYVIKSLLALKETVESEVKSAAKEKFFELGLATKVRPENFNAVDGLATVSCQLRARSSASTLTEDEQKVLAVYNIPTKKNVITVGAFVINPDYTNNQEVLSKVEKALKKVPGLPADFIQVQDEVSKTVPDDSAIALAFSTLDNVQLRAVLPILTLIATGPKLDPARNGGKEIKFADAFKIVEELTGEIA